MSTSYCIVLVTLPEKTDAAKFARELLDKKLAACVNMLPSCNSLYWWEGKIEEAKETLLIIKTTKNIFDELLMHIKSIHPYSTPEIISLDITKGNIEYLDWLGANCSFRPPKIKGDIPK